MGVKVFPKGPKYFANFDDIFSKDEPIIEHHTYNGIPHCGKCRYFDYTDPLNVKGYCSKHEKEIPKNEYCEDFSKG